MNNKKDMTIVFSAEMDTPMGNNSLIIYEDNTFIFKNRRLLKKTFYKGTVEINQDTLQFNYSNSVPDFGKKAVIDGIFLTYDEGLYSNEVLEIKLNKLND